jgi:hypothetical protein
MILPTDAVSITPVQRDMINMFIHFLPEEEVETKTITPAQGEKFKGDFFGLLGILKVSPILFPVTLLLNGFTNPVEYSGDLLNIKLASEGDATTERLKRVLDL